MLTRDRRSDSRGLRLLRTVHHPLQLWRPNRLVQHGITQQKMENQAVEANLLPW